MKKVNLKNIDRVGLGTVSLLLVLAWILCTATVYGFSLGDYLIEKAGLPLWTDESNPSRGMGYRLTPYYGFMFILPAIFLGKKYENHRGAKAGRIASIVILIAAILFVPVTFIANRLI